MPSDGWGSEHIGNLAVPMRAVKAGTVSHLLYFGDFKHWRNHKITSGLTLTYDDTVSSQGKTKCPVFKSLLKLNVQDTRGGEENDLQTIQKQVWRKTRTLLKGCISGKIKSPS